MTVHILSPKSHNLCFEAVSFPCFLFQTGEIILHICCFLPMCLISVCKCGDHPSHPIICLFCVQGASLWQNKNQSLAASQLCLSAEVPSKQRGQQVRCKHWLSNARIEPRYKKPWLCRGLNTRWGCQVFSLSNRPLSVYLQITRWLSSNGEEHHHLLRRHGRLGTSDFSSADRLHCGHPPHFAVGQPTL